MKAPQINQIHFLLNRNVSLGNETNGNEVRRGSADGAALLGCVPVSSSKRCQKGKRTPGNSHLLFFGGVKRFLISTFDRLRLTLICWWLSSDHVVVSLQPFLRFLLTLQKLEQCWSKVRRLVVIWGIVVVISLATKVPYQKWFHLRRRCLKTETLGAINPQQSSGKWEMGGKNIKSL